MANTLQRKIAGSEVFCLGFGTANLGGGYSGGQTKPDEERFKVNMLSIFTSIDSSSSGYIQGS